ncbi:uncharacterized protein N7459_004679 [Penicillium hispanicum]|uniref:uncharacterized protein n=1 Tax=Penicillium hispanicum TaxID=1080232 RepID=UPI00254044C1|nr:uncharacterized protein N7459_004679 [Penicillium hispanicum]KAJ5584879.1 hypothetical protein N7459_004679 [Penicillium hispanicum]
MAEDESQSSNPRSFTGQSVSAEDMLKSQTVGLVHLSDFRKRRAEVLEQKEREAHDKSLGRLAPGNSRSATPSTGDVTDGSTTPRSDGPPKKKKKKPLAKSKLSFGDDHDDTGEESTATLRDSSVSRSGSKTPGDEGTPSASVRMKANPNALPPPKAMTKAAIEAEAQARDILRKEFLVMQETVKNTEILIPFVFFDGTSIPAGSVKMKKGDPVWLFLDRCRKVGADLGVRGASGAAKARKDTRREWARVSVDDLMLVKGDVIVPHHYEFYYFIANKVPSFSRTGGLLFDYSDKPPAKSNDDPSNWPSDDKIEGADNDSADTKVVDRRCHIFCLGCADGLGLSHPSTDDRRCPACQTVLSNPDDAVSTVLNPTEDYKTSVLSGLDPNTIMECAGRALGFWAYQSTQEIFYQEFLGKSLTEKYTSLRLHMDKVIHNSNTEISTLHGRVSDMQAIQEQLEKKNQELVDLYREKSKKLTQMTNLYHLLKARAMRSQMQTAASDTVSQALNTIHTISSRSDPTVSITQSGPSRLSTIQTQRPPRTPSFPISPDGIEQLHRYQRSGTGSSRRVGKRTADTADMPPPQGRGVLNAQISKSISANPQHRTRLPQAARPPTSLAHLPSDDEILARFGT